MQQNRTIMAIIIVAVVVIAGALGVYAVTNNSGGSSEQSEVQTETFVEEPTLKPIRTITDILSDSETLILFLSGLAETELDDVLSSEGPYTVFAPIDTAFGELPESRTDLKDILNYHIVEGSFGAADLTEGRTFTTLQGSTVRVVQSEGYVSLEDSTGATARILSADAAASNGVFHVIDKVMLPN